MTDLDTTTCVLPHRREREKAETWTAPDGTEQTAVGGEAVWDHDNAKSGSHPGSLLCPGHLEQLRSCLAELPDIAERCRDDMHPGAGGQGPHIRAAKPGSRMPMRVDSVDDADDILAWLWAQVVEVAPEIQHEAPSLRAWRANRGQVRGVAYGDHSPILAVAEWLLSRLDVIAKMPWVGDMVLEVRQKRNELLGRHPYEEDPVYLPSPCPSCELLTLVRKAPRWAGGPVSIACEDARCGLAIPEDNYPWMTKVLAAEHQARKASA